MLWRNSAKLIQNSALVNYLIENKADLSLRDENQKTISHYAVKQQFVKMLHYLIEKQKCGGPHLFRDKLLFYRIKNWYDFDMISG